MIRTVRFPSRLCAKVHLPASKSLSNRALLLASLSGPGSSVEHLSSCDDTYVLWRALHERPYEVDVQAAGTAMRFLTAYFSVCEGEEHVLTGTPRMLQRPIGVLVDALRSLGADVSYTGREGYPPLRVRGRALEGGSVQLPADVSSQYISALLMVAPLMRGGLRISLSGQVLSRPYIDMTLSLMRTFGAEAAWHDDTSMVVEPGVYAPHVIYPVEGDWSASSYWYEMVALSPDERAAVELPWLFRHSLQGDSCVSRLFEDLGVHTEYGVPGGMVRLTKRPPFAAGGNGLFERDLSACPDLAQTLVVTCAMMKRPFRFRGLRSLRIKETDRIEALCEGLAHFGLQPEVTSDDTFSLTDYPSAPLRYDGQPIATHDDHRQAMAFAPAALVAGEVYIADPEVVSKSYPRFWRHLDALREG